MDDGLRNLIFQVIDETISPKDFERLQDAIEQDDEARDEYLEAVWLFESLCEIAHESQTPNIDSLNLGSSLRETPRQTKVWNPVQHVTLAAVVVIVVSGFTFWLGRSNVPTQQQQVVIAEPPEPRFSGHASLKRAVGLRWPSNAVRHLEGDILPNGLLAFDAGTAEIDFFCGATLIVEGPAELDIESDWSIRVTRGRLRASVPPAARGFVVKAADSEIVDLGTEFALEVDSGNARVEVIDGEVEIRGGAFDGRHLQTGEGKSLKGSPAAFDLAKKLSTFSELSLQRQQADERLFERWKQHSQQLRLDDRLIAYYPIAEQSPGRIIANVALSGSQFSGLVAGPVERSLGRFGVVSSGLEFERTGARMRTRIDGEFRALTFSCWVKIDGLEHRYNALFMGDGFENGEPHWQIRNDGRMMISVMVDETQKTEYFSDLELRRVTTAGLHKNYYSEPFWTPSMSGHWFHLASVYDPENRVVRQYSNGQMICDEEITDEFLAKQLRIGPAEIGNWGQPFRKTPEFAARNLNGTIDELAIFNAALSHEEIRSIYEQGKPLGY